MVFIYKLLWYVCGVEIYIKHSMMVHNIFTFGSQERLPLVFLILIRKFIIPQLFSYSSFRILCSFTVDESRSLELVSILYTHALH